MQIDDGELVLPCSSSQTKRKGSTKMHTNRLFSKEQVGRLFDKELVDSSIWGDRQVTDIGEECTLRTFGVVFDDTKGLRVLADTQYFIEVHGHEVYVDATTLGTFLTKYANGGVEAAEKYLNRLTVNLG